MKKKGHLLDTACPLDEPLFSSESERRNDRNCFMFVSLWLGDRLSTQCAEDLTSVCLDRPLSSVDRWKVTLFLTDCM